MAIVISRTPDNSGTVHTYTYPLADASSPAEFDESRILVASENNDVTFCLDAGTTVRSATQAVVIREFSSSRNSIETLGDDNGC